MINSLGNLTWINLGFFAYVRLSQWYTYYYSKLNSCSYLLKHVFISLLISWPYLLIWITPTATVLSATQSSAFSPSVPGYCLPAAPKDSDRDVCLALAPAPDTVLSSSVRLIVNASYSVLWFNLRCFTRFVVLPQLLTVFPQTSQTASWLFVELK